MMVTEILSYSRRFTILPHNFSNSDPIYITLLLPICIFKNLKNKKGWQMLMLMEIGKKLQDFSFGFNHFLSLKCLTEEGLSL